jgi:Flp pilus assembly protein TadG
MRFFDDWKFRRRLRSSGQALILIVLTFMGLLLFLGLMIDLGQIFLAKGYLRRAADAASLAAAAQFRENRGISEMTKAAEEVSKMNGIDPTMILVETCASTGGTDTELCPQLVAGHMPKKLVRVTIILDYPMTFLSLLDIYTVRLKEVSVSEAASMDVVLVIDVSESMAWKGDSPATPGDPDQRDPSVCNYSTGLNNCKPMTEAKIAAENFAAQILNKPTDEEDRLAIVTFATGWQSGSKGTQVLNLGINGWTTDLGEAQTAINQIDVYDPGVAYSATDEFPTDNSLPANPVRFYGDDGSYLGMQCLRYWIDATPASSVEREAAISACGTTNIGGGLLLAGNQFARDKRPEALWVVILLTDGTANATFAVRQDINQTPEDEIVIPTSSDLDWNVFIPNFPLGFCPSGTYLGESDGPYAYCQDGDATSHHASTSAAYDADDYARDMARFVGCPAVLADPQTGCNSIEGQGAVIFTIGLGDEVARKDTGGVVAYGGSLLRFIAALGDDGNPDTDSCDVPATRYDYKANCGNYYYAQEGTDLDKIFEAIYSRIFTRLTA